MVDEQILRRRKLRGRYELVDEPAQKDDMLVADVGAERGRCRGQARGQRDVWRAAGAGGRHSVIDADETLTGVKPGEARQADCVIPDDFEQADLRGKAAGSSSRCTKSSAGP